jgi:hypothetical protein
MDNVWPEVIVLFSLWVYLMYKNSEFKEKDDA